MVVVGNRPVCLVHRSTTPKSKRPVSGQQTYRLDRLDASGHRTPCHLIERARGGDMRRRLRRTKSVGNWLGDCRVCAARALSRRANSTTLTWRFVFCFVAEALDSLMMAPIITTAVFVGGAGVVHRVAAGVWLVSALPYQTAPPISLRKSATRTRG